LQQQFGSGSILTIPLGEKDPKIGALTLERSVERPFDKATVDVCETAASLAAPIIEAKRLEDRWIIKKAIDSSVSQLKLFLGPGHLVRKIAAVAFVFLMLFFSFFKTDYRVTATSSIEGRVKRVIAAPFDGYVKEAPIRAGDVVGKGDVIGLLDDRDLRLERLKWATEKEQVTKQYHEAMANHDRSRIQIARAKIDQAEAQIELLDEQLARTKLIAPFDALVMSGDLSQSLGSPVERGQVLFEVAPLDEYRVIIEVDERDIADIRVGQKSEMIFSSIPGESFPFVIQNITPVTIAKEGRNYYRVEGQVEKVTDRLRPGMEGVGKITAGRRRLIWIWTHKAFDWLRLKIWQWTP
jgi:multidrug resistance efflux pump